MERSLGLACLLEVGIEGFARSYGLLEEGLRQAVRLDKIQLRDSISAFIAVPIAVLLKLSCRMPV